MVYNLKYIFILLGILTLSINAFAQVTIIDSLKLALKNAKHDTTRCNILEAIIENENDDKVWSIYNDQLLNLAKKNLAVISPFKTVYLKYFSDASSNLGIIAMQHGDYVKALEFYYKALKIQEEINYKRGIATSLNNIGNIYDIQGDIFKALYYYKKSLKIEEGIKNKIGIATSLNNLGFIYKSQGDVFKALEYYHKSLKLYEEMNDKDGIATAINNIGAIFKDQDDYIKALEYYHKSLKIYEDVKNKRGIASTLNNIGIVYKNQRDYKKALENYYKCLRIREEINDKKGVANSLNNIGGIYKNQDDIPKALECLSKSLKIREEINDKTGIAQTLNIIGRCLIEQGKLTEALVYSNLSLKLSKELGYPENIKNTASILKKIYIKQNRYEDAFEMYELEIQMKDSINNKETKKASVKKQFQYQYEKQAAADSVKHGEEQKVKNALLTAQQAQLKQEKTKSYALYGGLALVLVFAGFMVNRFRVTHKQKQIIELKEVETQKQNVVITQQKHLVEEKHKEITDSINYAERIQRSFLATKEQLDINLKNYFVLFQPKDVVSGDFYWAHTLKNGNFALVTADSTGHGVPGAIMSLLNTSALEKAVELGICEPGEILNHTRATIIERLKKDGSIDGGKDGMDCSLISLNKEKSKLVYAAANNPIWIVRKRHCEGNSLKQSYTSDQIASLPRNDENYELVELKSDKIPVGKHDRDSISFTQHEVELQKGDMIYTLTDGFPDQFGGPKGKKFMYKKLKEMLVSISQLPLKDQHEFLKNSLNDWKGDLEQVDDICIIGIKV